MQKRQKFTISPCLSDSFTYTVLKFVPPMSRAKKSPDSKLHATAAYIVVNTFLGHASSCIKTLFEHVRVKPACMMNKNRDIPDRHAMEMSAYPLGS